jgi:hypothetical protein
LVFGCIFAIREASYINFISKLDEPGLDKLGFDAAQLHFVSMMRNIGYTDYVEGVAFFFVRIRYPGVNKAIRDFVRCSKSKESPGSSGKPSTRRSLVTPGHVLDTTINDTRNTLVPFQPGDYHIQPEPKSFSEPEHEQVNLRLATSDEPGVNFDGITEPYRDLTIHTILNFIGQVYWKRV